MTTYPKPTPVKPSLLERRGQEDAPPLGRRGHPCFVLLLSALIPLLLTATASASPLVIPTALTIRHSETEVFGELFASRHACSVGQTVVVTFDGDTERSTTTTDEGAYRVTIPEGATTARASFDGAVLGTHPATRVCRASVSRLDHLAKPPPSEPQEPRQSPETANLPGTAFTGGPNFVLRVLGIYAFAVLMTTFGFAFVYWRRRGEVSAPAEPEQE